MTRSALPLALVAALTVGAAQAQQYDPMNPGATPPPAPAAAASKPRTVVPIAPGKDLPAGVGYARQLFAKDGLWEVRRRDAQQRTVNLDKPIGTLCITGAVQQQVDYVRFRWIGRSMKNYVETTTPTKDGFTAGFVGQPYMHAAHARPRVLVTAVVTPDRVILDKQEDAVDAEGRALMMAGEEDKYFKPATKDAPRMMAEGLDHRWVSATCPADLQPGQGRSPLADWTFDMIKGGKAR